MKTTLYALIRACETATIDGYEIDEFYFKDSGLNLHWNGGDDRAAFQDQELVFDDGRDSLTVRSEDGEYYELEFFNKPRRLTPLDVAVDHEASCEIRSARIQALTMVYAPMADADIDDGKQALLAGLLADVRHWCDKHGVDFDAATDLSYGHYLAEKSSPAC